MLFVDEFCGILVYIKFGADVTSQYDDAVQESEHPEHTELSRAFSGRGQEIGDIFERHMKSLLEELLTTDGGGVEITEVRRQCSGTQFGFDLRCTYLDPGGQPCNCLFECKDVEEIRMADMMGKLAQARMSQSPVNHWVLASPKARISNDLGIYLPRLEREVKECKMFKYGHLIRMWKNCLHSCRKYTTTIILMALSDRGNGLRSSVKVWFLAGEKNYSRG